MRHSNGDHLDALIRALRGFRSQVGTVEAWGHQLAAVLGAGGRLLACGNGGSAAQAQHLTAELVGRYRADRRPYAAIPLHADTSATTAIANDYSPTEVFARQVHAHTRPGDVLVCLSTSGASANVLAAARAASAVGASAWALTGPAPNPLASVCDDAIAVDAVESATIQEVHLAVIHLLCAVVDAAADAGMMRGASTR